MTEHAKLRKLAEKMDANSDDPNMVMAYAEEVRNIANRLRAMEATVDADNGPVAVLRQVEEEMRQVRVEDGGPASGVALPHQCDRWAARIRGAREGMREEIARIEEQVRVVVDGSDPISITLRGDGDWFRAHLLRLRTLRLQMESGEQDKP